MMMNWLVDIGIYLPIFIYHIFTNFGLIDLISPHTKMLRAHTTFSIAHDHTNYFGWNFHRENGFLQTFLNFQYDEYWLFEHWTKCFCPVLLSSAVSGNLADVSCPSEYSRLSANSSPIVSKECTVAEWFALLQTLISCTIGKIHAALILKQFPVCHSPCERRFQGLLSWLGLVGYLPILQ